MGTPLQDAADQLTGFVQRLAPLQVVADALKGIASLDNAVTEKQAALDAATKEQATIDLSMSEAKDKLKALKKQISDQVSAANAKTDEVLSSANDSAAKTLADANASAKAIESQARSAADKIIDAANAELVILQNKKTALGGDIDALTASKAQAQAELDDITAKVSAIKATINGSV
jgi:chromosome segregation ATPase